MMEYNGLRLCEGKGLEALNFNRRTNKKTKRKKEGWQKLNYTMINLKIYYPK